MECHNEILGPVHMSPATLVLTSVGQILSAFIWLFSSHLTRKKLFSSHLIGMKLKNKHGAVCFDTSSYTWYYDCCHPSELINIELTCKIRHLALINVYIGKIFPPRSCGWRVHMVNFHLASPRSHPCTMGSHQTGLVRFHMNTDPKAWFSL